MPKLTLVANPKFTADVLIPIAGGDPIPVKFEFRHRTKQELDEFMKSREGKTDEQSIMEMVVSWPGLEDEFNLSNVELLLQNRIGAALAIYRKYVEELLGARIKN